MADSSAKFSGKSPQKGDDAMAERKPNELPMEDSAIPSANKDNPPLKPEGKPERTGSTTVDFPLTDASGLYFEVDISNTEARNNVSEAAEISEPVIDNNLIDKEPTVISKHPPMERPPVAQANARALAIAAKLEDTRLGYFQLGPFVGGGGMGAVFRATDTMLDRTVAVKVLSRENEDDHDMLRRFKNEAQSAARLDHDNIARVYYVGADKGWNYIVFEYIEGLNIRELVEQQGKLPLADALNYTLQVADALEHAYQRDVVHRDIKPSNIIITLDGHAKLVDMGLARLQAESPASELTSSGVTLGTFDYISPEQAYDPRSADVRSDLYSLGCTLYFMLTCSAVFPEGNALQKMFSHSSSPPPDPRHLRPNLPDVMVAILARLLEKEPSDRYQTPSELIGELLLACEQLGLSGATRGGTVYIAPAEKKVQTWKRHLPWLIAVASVITLVFCIDRFWPTQASDASAEFSSISIEPADPPSLRRETTPPPDNETEDSSPGGDAKDPSEASEVPPTPPVVPSPTEKPERDTVPTTPPPAPTTPEVSPTTVAQATTRIIVVGGNELTTPAEDELWVNTLSDACMLAADLPELEAIELRYSGQRRSEPVRIRNKRLTIRAGEGSQPVVLFDPTSSVGELTPGFVQIDGGEVVFENVHFRAVLPSAPYQIMPWALFRLEQVVRLAMTGCTMTIENIDSRGAEPQIEASFLLVDGVRSDSLISDGLLADQPISLVPPLIELQNCIARGQATMIFAEKATPFRFNWVQGLFASTRRLFHSRGADADISRDGYVTINLEHVTTIAEQGLALVERAEDTPGQLGLSINCRRCIFVTNPSAPLVEHDGFTDTELSRRNFRLTGEDNFFHQTMIVWKLNLIETGEQVFDFDAASRDQMWYQFRFAGRAVLWQETPASDPFIHLHRADEYLLKDTPENPALALGGEQVSAGFSINELPKLPEYNDLDSKAGET